MLSDREEIVKETLAWCNSVRARYHKSPLNVLPKGRIADPHSCPCGAATDMYVGARYYGLKEGGPNYPLPSAVIRFIRLFDNGDLPEYIEKRKEV